MRIDGITRTIPSHQPALSVKAEQIRVAIDNPVAVTRELNNRSLYNFIVYFWPIVSSHNFVGNWHIEYLCRELEQIAIRVAEKKPKEYDLIINLPPGSTKTITVSIMFPVWCWTIWHWMRFICASYSEKLSLESAEASRELIRSARFQQIYPFLEIKDDKDVKSNYRVVKKFIDTSPAGRVPRYTAGGFRFSTSVGGTLMGFHGDILIVDDPLNPMQSVSEIELGNANRWMEQTLSTRKTDKLISPTILIMQRLHQDDPTGHWLNKQKENIRHICLPGEIQNYHDLVRPAELVKNYHNGLMDINRLPWEVLKDLEADLGQYGYAGQIGQNPTPPGGGMFKVDRLTVLTAPPHPLHIVKTVRYWDKAGTETLHAPFTAGVKMCLLKNSKWVIMDVKRGRWGTEERESIIRSTAEADGIECQVWVEQEPGSGGKESAQGTILNLGGFSVYADRPSGKKELRADPFSVQVNNGNVSLLIGMWHNTYIEEMRFFPSSTFKDQIDASSGAFSKLTQKRVARRVV